MMPTLPVNFRERITGAFGSEGERWLSKLPATYKTLLQEWKLSPSDTQPELSYNFICRVTREDSSLAVLKIGFHGHDHSREVNSLTQFDGQGAVRVLATNPSLNAYLMENIFPGSELKSLYDLGQDEEATRICSRVITKLQGRKARHSTGSCKPVAKLTDDFNTYLLKPDSKGVPRDEVHEANKIFVHLLETSSAEVLLHGDLHHQNILQSEARGWLAIDPKGFVGDPCFEIGAFMRNPMCALITERVGKFGIKLRRPCVN